MRRKTARARGKYRKPLYYLFAPLMTLILICGVVLYLYRGDSSAGAGGGGRDKAIVGGTFEASGVTRVPGANGVVFVDDGRPGEILWMPLGSDGTQSGAVKPVGLSVQVEDPEGITTDGSYFYVVGSQSKSAGVEQAGIVRFKFNHNSQRVEDVQTVIGLKRFLIDNVSELRDLGAVKAKDDGINIEGIAWDPTERRLLLGLRSPVINGNALIVPLKLRDPEGPFTSSNLEAGAIKTVRLSLKGHGIRSIEYDERSSLFLIIAGATETQDKTESKLWEWGGKANSSLLREVTAFDRKLKPEGITRASSGGSEFKLVVFDTSRYLVME